MAAEPAPFILLVGGLPPPVGGVSVHLQRLCARLTAEGWRWRVADDGRCRPLLLPLLLASALLRHRLGGGALVHVHSGNWRTRLLCALLGRLLGLPVLLTLHSFRPLDNPRTRRLARAALRLCRGVVAVSAEVRARCLEYGARPEQVRVQYAYLDPPALGAGPLPAAVREFLARHQPRLAASAFRLRFHEGLDLYGLDLLVELVHQLRRTRPAAGLVFVLPEIGLPDYLARCRTRLDELGLAEHVLIITDSLEFPALLRECDLLVRPTTSDGDSLSLREAQFSGCRCLASDAVPRPEGVALFRSRDGAHLLQRCGELLAEPKPAPRAGQDGWAGLAAAYRQVLRG
ncbi:MAG: glycosyltransferase [Candidatus Delongbacteria bacterium]